MRGQLSGKSWCLWQWKGKIFVKIFCCWKTAKYCPDPEPEQEKFIKSEPQQIITVPQHWPYIDVEGVFLSIAIRMDVQGALSTTSIMEVQSVFPPAALWTVGCLSSTSSMDLQDFFPTQAVTPSFNLRTVFVNAGLSGFRSVRLRYRNEKECRCRNQSGTGIRGPILVTQCSGTNAKPAVCRCRAMTVRLCTKTSYLPRTILQLISSLFQRGLKWRISTPIFLAAQKLLFAAHHIAVDLVFVSESVWRG